MAEILVGEQVVNKTGEVGTILSFENSYIQVDFDQRVTYLMEDAFEKGFLRYAKAELQNPIDQTIAQTKQAAEQKTEAERQAKEIARNALNQIQRHASRTQRGVSVLSATFRLDPAPVTFNAVRKGDQSIIQEVFDDCDQETTALFQQFHPDMQYLRGSTFSHARSKYCVGYLCKYRDVYVFRVFSRNDEYKHNRVDGITVRRSDTTEVLRILRVNGRDYYFSKNVSFSHGYFTNSDSFNNWHVSNVDSSILLGQIIRICDCGYLNAAIEEKNIECLQYVKLLFSAFSNPKMEVVFKNKAFSSAHRIPDLEHYLEEFSSKHIDYASKHNALNALPFIKRNGLIELPVLKALEAVMRCRQDGSTLYSVLKGRLAQLGVACPDLDVRILGFLRKVPVFNYGVYFDYINELALRPGSTLQDFFDRDYMARHQIMMREKKVQASEKDRLLYQQAARELAWINREEQDRFIILPETIADFQYEGEMQHNCVYTCQYFYEVINRRSIIVFLREEKYTPFVTIEYDYETFDVLQAYGKYNADINPTLFQYVEDLGKRLYCERLSQQ